MHSRAFYPLTTMSYSQRPNQGHQGFYHDPYATTPHLNQSLSGAPLYPPAALTGSSYSLTDHYTGDEEKDGYAAVQPEEEEERTPFAQTQSFQPEAAFGVPTSQYSPYTRQGGLTRRETNAEGFRLRQKTMGRTKTKKVVLRNGHFIADYAVPTAVRNANKNAPVANNDHPEEFTHLRYTAATCDPDDFTSQAGWSLRASNWGRETELLVAITYYNEDKILMARTLHGVMTNLADIVSARWSEFRRNAERGGGEGGVASGTDGWKRIVVTLIFDGLDPADKETLDLLATLGIYQDAVMQRSVDGVETQAHIFEFTSSLSMSPKLKLVYPQPGDAKSLVPVQFIFVLKAKNGKKINSHRWLFNAIGRHLNPEICILLDAGTKPGNRSLYYLWEAFHHNPNLGGSCGEIHAMLSGGRKLLNPLVAAQNFEYKISNILDKTLEASFGYVSVLPGAFSAYRYRAIQGRPLEQPRYFHGDHSLANRLGNKGIYGMSIFKKNMFLAEDRILCFELVAKANEKWTLSFVKPAKGETDVPEQAAELIGQRRRWLNGSLAAGVYSLAHFPRLYKSGHGFIRLFFFHIQFLYNTVNLFMSWFQLGNWYLSFAIIIQLVADSLRNPPEGDDHCWSGSVFEKGDSGFFHKHDFLGDLSWVLIVIYLLGLGLQIILALGNRPKAERVVYTISFLVFAAMSLWLLANTIFLTVKAFCPISGDLSEAKANGKSFLSVILGGTFGPILAGLVGTFGVYLIASILYLDPWHLLHSMPQFMLISISFTNILMTYALCNLHDVSWGTKGSDKADALPEVKSKKTADDDAVVEVAEKVQQDLDEAFEATVKRAVRPLDIHEEVEKPTMDDSNRTFRTRLVICWLFCNAMLALVISRLGASARVRYFQALLWVTFFLSFFRFLGFLWFMFGEAIFRLARLCRIRAK